MLTPCALMLLKTSRASDSNPFCVNPVTIVVQVMESLSVITSNNLLASSTILHRSSPVIIVLCITTFLPSISSKTRLASLMSPILAYISTKGLLTKA
uniref:Uncharacterized protein n=1 Tax=Arundo donax TaxID=35708 RepID=A0A0A9A793_ARUDO